MENKKNEFGIKIYGLEVYNGSMLGSTLVKKLKAFLDSLREAEKYVNHKKAYDYVVKDLSYGSACFSVAETRVTKNHPIASGIDCLASAMEKVYNSDPSVIEFPKKLVTGMKNMASGAGSAFSHAEIGYSEQGKIIRIDDYFLKKANDACRLLNNESCINQDIIHKTSYKGIVFSSFNGMLQELDARGGGTLVRGKLILSAGDNIQIDCIMNQRDIPKIKECFNIKSIIEGLAHYDGESRLPVRIDVKSIKPIKENADLLKWCGAFNKNDNEDMDW